MRNIILAFMLLASSCLTAQIKKEVAYPFEGHLREWIISIPTTPPPAEGYPVVMMLHGTSGDKNVFYNAHGWRELGEQENFITIYPSALSWCFFDDGVQKMNTKFVCGDLVANVCPSDSADLVDDVAFFRDFLDRLQDSIPVDPNRIFGSGFSNGCVMIHKVAMEAGDLFRAIGSTSGVYHELDSITPTHRVPVWWMLGTLDDRFIQPPYTEIPFGGDSSIAYVNKYVRRTLASLGLTETFTKFETPITKTWEFTECRPGEDCTPYRFTIIKGLPHQFPNGWNVPVDGPALFWDFFNNPPEVTTSLDPTNANVQTIHSWPNPASDQMIVSFNQPGNKVTVEVFDLQGHIVWSSNTLDDHVILSRSDIGSGIFIVRVQSGISSSLKKVVFY